MHFATPQESPVDPDAPQPSDRRIESPRFLRKRSAKAPDDVRAGLIPVSSGQSCSEPGRAAVGIRNQQP
jgi:hypothetical protein